MEKPKDYETKTGFDGLSYAVFPSSYERELFMEQNPTLVAGLRVACFGQFENAFCLHLDK